jgi:phage gp37-like protein
MIRLMLDAASRVVFDYYNGKCEHHVNLTANARWQRFVFFTILNRTQRVHRIRQSMKELLNYVHAGSKVSVGSGVGVA